MPETVSTSTSPLSASVLVVDSGVGGLSVCQSILLRCPGIKIRYLADNAAFPYGNKSEDFLVSRLGSLIQACHDQFDFDLVVLACNTISTLVLPSLRARFDIPIVGVVPAIKPASIASKSQAIALLATPGTVSRPYTDQLVRDFAPDCQVLKIGSSVLVDQAEALLAGRKVDIKQIEAELYPITQSGLEIDTVVLGCTHFPLLQPYFDLLLPAINWVDSGEAIARRVESLLIESRVRVPQDNARHSVMFTKAMPDSVAFEDSLRGLGLDDVELRVLNI